MKTRRGMAIGIVLMSTIVFLSGIRQLFAPFDTIFDWSHVIPSFILVGLICIHLWLNRKALVRYFTRPGKWWWLIGPGIAVIVFTCIVRPIMMARGAM